MSQPGALPGALPGTTAESVIRNLERQALVYEQLTALARRQLEALLGGRSEDLGDLLRSQDDAILSLQSLETERLVALEPLAAARACPPESLALADLLADAPPAAADRLAALGERLSAAISGLRALNDRNRRLVTAAAGWLDRWRLYLFGSLQPAATYSARGGREYAPASLSLDRPA